MSASRPSAGASRQALDAVRAIQHMRIWGLDAALGYVANCVAVRHFAVAFDFEIRRAKCKKH